LVSATQNIVGLAVINGAVAEDIVVALSAFEFVAELIPDNEVIIA